MESGNTYKSVEFRARGYDISLTINGFKPFFDGNSEWCNIFVTLRKDAFEETVGGEEIDSSEVYEMRLFLEKVLTEVDLADEDLYFSVMERFLAIQILPEEEYMAELTIPIKDVSGKYQYSGSRKLLLDKASVIRLYDYLKDITKDQHPTLLLCELLDALPPDYDTAIKLIDKNDFNEEDLTLTANWLIWSCIYSYRLGDNNEILDDHRQEHLSYIKRSLDILLKSGLNPNCFDQDHENVMFTTQYIEDTVVGPQIMKMLLESGGDPNLDISDSGLREETLFEYIDEKICMGDGDEKNESLVRCWLLLMAYGGKYDSGGISLEMLDGTPIEAFKDVEKYRIELEYLPGKGALPSFCFHIFDKETNKEVAR